MITNGSEDHASNDFDEPSLSALLLAVPIFEEVNNNILLKMSYAV